MTRLLSLVCFCIWLSAGGVSSQNQPILANVARNKPAYQIGRYGKGYAGNAVDGKYDEDYPEDDEFYLTVCAYPDASWHGQVPAHWWVDLEANYRIYNITIYNTFNEAYFRMNDFTVEVVSRSNTTTTCGDYRRVNPVSRGGSQTFDCRGAEGRSVHVRRLDGSEDQYLITICEVEVQGQPLASTPMPEATVAPPADTSVAPPGEVTAPVTSTAPDQTTTRTITSDECPDGRYGDSCRESCDGCAAFASAAYKRCDPEGRCLKGCVAWRIGDKCQTEIAKLNYSGQEVNTVDVSSGKIELELEQIPVPSDLAQYYGYRVTYNDKTLHVKQDGTKSHVMIVLAGLRYNNEYVVHIEPYRVLAGKEEFGRSYPKLRYKTLCEDPDPIIITSIEKKYSNSGDPYYTKVTYQRPDYTGCDRLTSIRAHYQIDGQSEWILADANVTGGSVEMTSTESKAFTVRLIAVNNEGRQRESISPVIQVSFTSTSSVFSRDTLLPWSLFIVSCVVNLCVITFLANACCGKTPAGRAPPAGHRSKSPDPDDVYSQSAIEPTHLGAPDVVSDDVYATHIDDGVNERKAKGKKPRKFKRVQKSMAPHYKDSEPANEYSYVP